MKKNLTITLLPFWLLLFHARLQAQGDTVFFRNIASIGPLQFNFNSDSFYLDTVYDKLLQQQVHKINAKGSTPLLSFSNPDVPKFAATFIIPSSGNYEIKITSSSYYEIKDVNLLPAKGNLYRNINQDSVNYLYGDSYTKDEFFPSSSARVSHTFMLRDFKGITIHVFPFQYNPVQRMLRVYRNMALELFCTDDCETPKVSAVRNIDTEFDETYKRLFQNYEWYKPAYLPVDENGSMLIIAASGYLLTLQPLVDWKIRSGTATEVIDVNQIGNNAGAIKTYIQNYYINHPELKYILLAGDAQDVATPIFWGGAADPSYGYLNGNDSYAEVFVGRLSANTLAELQVQVAKILAYEINPDTTKTYYGHATVIGSNAGPGDDGEMDWEHARNLRTKLLAYTYANVQELYDGTHPGGNDASGDPLAFDFYTQLQNGISLATYTGHGTSSTFTTTGFNSNDISSLTNFNQWPYIWSVACANGDFNNGTCMAESFLRAEYNGQPTGAVATLMSSINQSWVPPMDAQDEFIDILTETYVNNIKRSFGGISVNGCMHMNDNYGPAGDEMTDTWCLFGDPSMQVRTAPPFVLAATHTTIISFNDNTLALSCNKQDGATVCLSNNGQLLDKQPLQNGQALLNFNSIGNQDTLQLTVYGYNCKPYLADINVLPVAQAEVQESGISIYPNPATSNLYLKTNTPILSIEILSMEGRMLKQWKENKNGAIDITIPIYDLSNGNYIAKIVINDKLFLKKFAVNR